MGKRDRVASPEWTQLMAKCHWSVMVSSTSTVVVVTPCSAVSCCDTLVNSSLVVPFIVQLSLHRVGENFQCLPQHFKVGLCLGELRRPIVRVLIRVLFKCSTTIPAQLSKRTQVCMSPLGCGEDISGGYQ